MPHRYPILRLVSPVAALAAVGSLLAGAGALVVLPTVGFFQGWPLSGLGQGLAFAAAGALAAFVFAAVGEGSELLLELKAAIDSRHDTAADGESEPRVARS